MSKRPTTQPCPEYGGVMRFEKRLLQLPADEGKHEDVLSTLHPLGQGELVRMIREAIARESEGSSARAARRRQDGHPGVARGRSLTSPDLIRVRAAWTRRSSRLAPPGLPPRAS